MKELINSPLCGLEYLHSSFRYGFKQFIACDPVSKNIGKLGRTGCDSLNVVRVAFSMDEEGVTLIPTAAFRCPPVSASNSR